MPYHITSALVLKYSSSTAEASQGNRLVGAASLVEWDQRRFVAPAHHDFSTIPNGGPALEASWSHPTSKKAMALEASPPLLKVRAAFARDRAERALSRQHEHST